MLILPRKAGCVHTRFPVPDSFPLWEASFLDGTMDPSEVGWCPGGALFVATHPYGRSVAARSSGLEICRWWDAPERAAD